MNKPTDRKNELAMQFLIFLDQHIEDVVKGRQTEFFSIRTIADNMAVSHTHFSFVIKDVLGQKPCHYYDQKIIDKAKNMLGEQNMTPADVARRLTYDPSNFSKFFKKWTGETPGQYKSQYVTVNISGEAVACVNGSQPDLPSDS